MFSLVGLVRRQPPGGEPIAQRFVSQPDDPNSAAIKWDGEWQITYETFRDMGLAYSVGLVLIYLLVVAQFGSYALPLIIMAPIPLTIIGVMPGHALLGAQFTATSMIGMIALAGIIVRNSILLVDFIDVEVRAGDKLVIPRKPNFVLVAGQVYDATAITYSAGKHAGWYLRQAGGPTPLGNKKEVFVVRANGSVVGKNSGQWWSGNVLNTVLQPGDTIFVPEKIFAGDKLKLFAESAQVLSGLAVAARVAISF
jgi:hypothetical protein